MALLGAVVIWSLLGKVVPPLYDDYGRVARLRGPVGLWNQLALLGDFALALALWHKRRAGTLLAYGWLVALALTYSRGGLVTAVFVVAAWLVLSDERIESAATLVAAALPAAVVVGIAFAAARRHERRRDNVDALARRADLRRARRRRCLRCSRALTRTASARHARAPACPLRRRSGRRRRRRGRRRLRRRLVHQLEPGRERLRSLHERRLELPLGVVAASLARVGRAPAGGDRRRLVPRHEPALPRLVPRRDDRAAQPAAAVPLGGRASSASCCCSSRSSRSCVRGGGGAVTSSRWRCSCPRSSSIR